MDGVIVVDKPREWTSHDVVNKMRRFAGTRKVGHLGTLDPGATGVLPLVIGRATRLAQFYTRNDKIYEGVIHFGYSTDSYDGDGQPASEEVPVTLDRGAARIGPRSFSRRDHADAAGRFGQENRRVAGLCPGAQASAGGARAGPGATFIRWMFSPSTATKPPCGCTARPGRICAASRTTRVRRWAAERFSSRCAGSRPAISKSKARGRWNSSPSWRRTAASSEALIPAAQLLPDFPVETVDSITASQIRNGRDFRTSPFLVRQQGARYVKAVSAHGELVAIGEARLPHLYHPVLVL